MRRLPGTPAYLPRTAFHKKKDIKIYLIVNFIHRIGESLHGCSDIVECSRLRGHTKHWH
ncbi:hypothetical protein CHELA1G11_11676 [Hyphomicrobiales bacterium]|nr:hypothetical protein CHELA1G11_11676 [Hyphomicrobiales bacterium]CAH1666089.1 hypothetical protein CHELA1G2_12632 [Hyphomicrobiales bacterium]